MFLIEHQQFNQIITYLLGLLLVLSRIVGSKQLAVVLGHVLLGLWYHVLHRAVLGTTRDLHHRNASMHLALIGVGRLATLLTLPIIVRSLLFVELLSDCNGVDIDESIDLVDLE